MWLEEEIFSNWGKISSSTVFGFLPLFLGFGSGVPFHVYRVISPWHFPQHPTAATAATIFSRHHFLRHPPPISYAILCKGHLLFTAQNPHLFFFPDSKIHIYSSDPSYLCFIISAFPLNLASENVKEQCKSPTVWFKVVFPTYKQVMLRINCKISLQFHYLWVYCSYTNKNKKANKLKNKIKRKLLLLECAQRGQEISGMSANNLGNSRSQVHLLWGQFSNFTC